MPNTTHPRHPDASHPAPHADSSPPAPHPDPHAELLAFLRNRSAPCPRCAYDLRDIQTPTCPECGEALVLKVGSAKPRFGWLILAMAPGCFSGVAALFVAVPIFVSYWQLPPDQRAPWPVITADAFGWLSAASVVLMYRHRHRLMVWSTRLQAVFAAVVWAVHILMFAVLLVWLWLVT